jgi:hypothetical protein
MPNTQPINFERHFRRIVQKTVEIINKTNVPRIRRNIPCPHSAQSADESVLIQDTATIPKKTAVPERSHYL